MHLAVQRQAGAPDVVGGLAPQLHGAARPPVLLLAVREEAGRQLQGGKDAEVQAWLKRGFKAACPKAEPCILIQ